MPSNTQNVKLGACRVTFDGVDLGYTKGGVEVEVATETKKVMVDQFGNSPINEYIIGRTCVAKIPLAETTIRNLVRVMPGATLSKVGAVNATGTVTFATSAPVNGDKVTINGVDFTFKTSPSAGNPTEMAIPVSIQAAATALRNAVNNSINPLVSLVTATVSAAVVTLTADDDGTDGNAITLAKTGTNITVSGATLSGGTNPNQLKAVIPNGVGTSLLALAKKLVIHPIALADDNRTEDFTIPIAMTSGQLQFAYKLDDERIYNVSFEGYPDPTTKTLFVYGDESAT